MELEECEWSVSLCIPAVLSLFAKVIALVAFLKSC